MKLLIVGKLDGFLNQAAKIALEKGAKIIHADTIEQAMKNLRAGSGVNLIMVDIQCDIGGLIKSLAVERFNIPVVACGIGTDADEAVRAIKLGAKEYIPLPPDSELIAAVLEAVSEESYDIICQDPVFLKVLRLAEQVASSDASILITGESGTGKEMLARFIHQKSKRSSKAFVSLNCAAIPENLLESELFGHEKGAFTGAIAKRIGKFEEANGGTLLLDEISEMHPGLQAKLLRAIQEREIDRVGGTKPVKVDIRVLATSNRDMQQEIKNEKFREDLFYRLNVVNICIPPLRERIQDIRPLAEFFIKKYSKANGLSLKKLSSQAIQMLEAYGWPGNVRELENTMHRSVLLTQEDEIEPTSIMLSDLKSIDTVAQLNSNTKTAQPIILPIGTDSKTGSDTAPNLVGRTVADVEQTLIIDTLKHCLGNRTHAATILGISIRTLRNKLKLYSQEGVQVPQVQASLSQITAQDQTTFKN